MQHLQQLENLFKSCYNVTPSRIEPLSNSSASPRQYFRIFTEKSNFIGAYNSDIKENKAFFYFSETFKRADIRVPQLIQVSNDNSYYIIEDLGDINLWALLKKEGESSAIEFLYQDAIRQLFNMQFFSLQNIDYRKYAYPRAEFDMQSILWDLNYFKYYFLKISGLVFDEQLLENDFLKLAQDLQNQKWIGFMFRDFQSRNIQVKDNQAWLIDYQGGRKGPVLYDLVSILYQASAELSPDFRNRLKNYYKSLLQTKFSFSQEEFDAEFNAMVFIRIVQTLGAYGYRGLIEHKKYFIDSIPFALENLEKLLKNEEFAIEIPYFIGLLNQLVQLKSKFVLK